MPVVAEIGGKLIKVTRKPLTHPEIEEIVRYIYGENGPGEIKSGYDLDPAHEVKIPGKGRKRYRVNITGGRTIGTDGIQITIRTLPEKPLDIHDLGIEPEIIENFRPPQGMVLVTGPTGSGKSTLLSSGIRMIIEQENANEKILEYSKPVEYVYDKVDMPSSVVFQTEVGKHLRPRGEADEESEFAYCVRNALRRKPSIIMIGEARDKATIQASVEAALTGHVLYSTMHTIGVAETLRRAIMPFPGDERRSMAVDIMETMRLSVTQILLPKVGGGKVGCREYMIFDEKSRNKFLDEEVDEWPQLARRLLEERKCEGSSMKNSAYNLLNQNLISEDTYNYIANRTKE
jgi:defect-in-organelle-trafficking protein DotB